MYTSNIGLEIHIRLDTESKIFCTCKAHYGDEPNTNICPVCMGYPGSLPALNAEAMRKAYAVAKALNCTLAPECMFERKNYFYPDLPKNYQISQFAVPLGTKGWIEIEYKNVRKRIRIRECHLEEDAGKMIHAGDMSLLDYNRTGSPLLEVVTEPDMEFGEEAEILLLELRRIAMYMGVTDGNMEEGSLKADANCSIRLPDAPLGNKVEIKNLNSARFIRKGLNYEIARQAEVLGKGGTVSQETRLWNENRDQTEVMRSKENSNDYRYFTEPDLPPFQTNPEFLASLDSLAVELPINKRERFVKDYGLSGQQTEFLCDDRRIADYFEAVCKSGVDPLVAATWMSGDVQKELNRLGKAIHESPLTAHRFASLLTLLAKGNISGKIAKQVLEMVFETDKDPDQIVKEKGLEQIVDPAVISAMVEEVLKNNPQAVAQIQGGDHKPLGFIAGQVLKASGGKADPKLVQEILSKRFGL